MKAIVAYDGTDFYGWQVQLKHPTIQSEIQNALQRIAGKAVGVTGAGRTDSGVHAYGQVAHFDWDHPLAVDRLQLGMNAILPETIRILSLEETPADFHARFDAKSKSYLYRIDRSRAFDVFYHRYAWQHYSPLDPDLLRQSAAMIEGEHDFAAFQASKTDVLTTRRTVYRVEVRDEMDPLSEGRFLYLRFTATGFLRKMVRFLVGTMVEIASAKRSIEDLRRALELQDKSGVGVPAAAHGLFLEKVYY